MSDAKGEPDQVGIMDRVDDPVLAHADAIGIVLQEWPMIKVTTSKARQEFARILKRVKQGRCFLLERHDKAVAAIVSVEDLALLEALENRRDLEDARRALAEVAEKGTIPWEQAKAELDLLDAGEDGGEQRP